MRSFVAISLRPNDILESAIHQVGQSGKSVEGRNLHITLKFLGEVKEIEEIRKNLGNIRFGKFTVTLKGMGAFPTVQNGRVLFVKAIPEDVLKSLAREVDSMTEDIPLDHPFTPHITLLRARYRRNFSDIVSRYENTKFLEQDVTSFALFESILKPTGPIYNVIEEYQLM
ncbi:MAG: RNA 2',3'-cyclic phosphodiesterase [Candidatus Thermoplasmatota archaeon]|nr:RNA 2',3'-cyclic phosphodiesterase [Candidatus Thermoplasmatota archaeon]MCL5789764.1 RNA 2',3'-cyclic phosphodiesterase [Candidatus Thermoplasmatota archaeon]